MADLPITGFDMAVIGILLISGIIAFARGFVRELLSIAGFILAALAAIWGFEPLSEPALEAISPGWLAKGIVIFGVFMAVYVGVTMVTNSISNMVHRSDRVGFFDRTLGFVFGLARGLVLCALALIIYNASDLGPAEDEEWAEEAVTFDLVKETADILRLVAPHALRGIPTDS